MDRIPTYHLNWGLISAKLFISKCIVLQNTFVDLCSKEEIYLFFKMRRFISSLNSILHLLYALKLN